MGAVAAVLLLGWAASPFTVCAVGLHRGYPVWRAWLAGLVPFGLGLLIVRRKGVRGVNVSQGRAGPGGDPAHAVGTQRRSGLDGPGYGWAGGSRR